MFGVNTYTLLYIKKIPNKNLLDSTGNYIQYLVIMGRKERKERGREERKKRKEGRREGKKKIKQKIKLGNLSIIWR